MLHNVKSFGCAVIRANARHSAPQAVIKLLQLNNNSQLRMTAKRNDGRVEWPIDYE
jgi:lysophospholipid acyltransferase (LPLAT)-like uncharacterized protein